MSTITGTIKHANFEAYVGELTFETLSAPLIHSHAIVPRRRILVKTDETGAFSIELLPGGYRLSTPTSVLFDISVPDDDEEYLTDSLRTTDFPVYGSTSSMLYEPVSQLDVRYLKRRSNGVFSIMDTAYAADPTGATDVRNALQAAANAARPGGGVVLIPYGDFRLNYGMTVDFSGVHVICQGKIWMSLPDDYTPPANPMAPGNDKYIATNQLNAAGALVSWDSSTFLDYYGSKAWNGKGPAFTGLGGDTGKWAVSGLRVDGGWGTTSKPSGIKAITGVRTDNDDFTYYQICNTLRNVTLRGCEFQNIPGESLMVCGGDRNVTVDDCTFGEHGDHPLYIAGANSVKITNSRILLNRASVGTNGNSNYVPQTWRDMVKIVAGNGTVIDNVTMSDDNAAPSAPFITLIATDSYGYATSLRDTTNTIISNNQFKGWCFIQGSNSRTTNMADNGGFRTRDTQVHHNQINLVGTSPKCMILLNVALDGFQFADNRIRSASSAILCQLNGNWQYDQAVKGFAITGKNEYDVTGTTGFFSQVYLGGIISDVTIRGAQINLGTVDCNQSTCGVALYGNSSTNDPYELVQLDSLTIEDSSINNAFAWVMDQGFQTWAALTSYTHSSAVLSDGTKVCPSHVSYNGVNYRTKSAVTGNAGNLSPNLDTTHWETYSQPGCKVIANRNKRVCNGAQAGVDGARYLLYAAALATTPLRNSYTIAQTGNKNTSTYSGALPASEVHPGNGTPAVVFTPAAQTQRYAPNGAVQDVSGIDLLTTQNNLTITGFSGGFDGKMITVMAGAGTTPTISHNGSTITATANIKTKAGTNLVMSAYQAAQFVYVVAGFWQQI